MQTNREIKQAMKVISEAMQTNEELAWGWQCNIAMSFVDVGGGHLEANIAAANFMKSAFGVDTTKFKEYKDIEQEYDKYYSSIRLKH